MKKVICFILCFSTSFMIASPSTLEEVKRESIDLKELVHRFITHINERCNVGRLCDYAPIMRYLPSSGGGIIAEILELLTRIEGASNGLNDSEYLRYLRIKVEARRRTEAALCTLCLFIISYTRWKCPQFDNGGK